MGKFYQALYEDLALYVRQLAWYQVTPENEESSRIQQLEADDMLPDLPECDGLYIVGYLKEVGFDNATSLELQAWSELSGIDLQAWEFDFIRKLSREYMSQYHDKKAEAPYQTEEISAHNANAIARKIRRSMNTWQSSDA